MRAPRPVSPRADRPSNTRLHSESILATESRGTVAPSTPVVDGLRTDVALTLSHLRGQRVLLWSNPGNAGDALIRVATGHALERAGVQAQRLGPGADVRGRTVLIIGGGNLVPPYREADTAFLRFRRLGAERIIVLPHTVRGNPACLEAANSDDIVLCRDAPSEHHVHASGTKATAFLAHDMAFHLDADAFLGDPDLAALASPALAATIERAGVGEVADRPVALLTRRDVERGPDSPSSDADISALVAFGGSPTASAVAAWCLLTFISRCAAIVTDRLHVAIGSALLGKPCTLLPNSYDKNAAVYKHSLSSFPHVGFAERWDGGVPRCDASADCGSG